MRHHPSVRPCSRPLGPAQGFTLIETALTTIIIGVGVLAVVEAQQAFLERNSWSTSSSTATYLANEVREWTVTFPRHDRFSGGIYFATPGDPFSFAGWGAEGDEATLLDIDDLDDLDGAVFGDAANFPAGFIMSRRFQGPVSAFGQPIPETLWDGTTEMFDPGDGTGPAPVPMRGWTQLVQVDKVSPFNLTQIVPDEDFTSSGGVTVREVDRYPLRVTVTVMTQPDPARPAEVSTSISWVVLP